MTYRLLIGTILSAILLITSCKRHDTSVTCTNSPIDVYGIGFPRPDTLADVLKYKQDNTFDSLIDSIQLTHFSFDTVYWPALQNITLLPGYDYKIVLPGTGNTYLVTKIKNGSIYHVEMASGTGNVCYNPIVSYALNDTEIAVTDTTQTHAPLTVYLYD